MIRMTLGFFDEPTAANRDPVMAMINPATAVVLIKGRPVIAYLLLSFFPNETAQLPVGRAYPLLVILKGVLNCHKPSRKSAISASPFRSHVSLEEVAPFDEGRFACDSERARTCFGSARLPQTSVRRKTRRWSTPSSQDRDSDRHYLGARVIIVTAPAAMVTRGVGRVGRCDRSAGGASSENVTEMPQTNWRSIAFLFFALR